MQLLNAISALFYFYVLVFAAATIILFIGLRMAYVAWTEKNDSLMRRAKLLLLFSVIAMLCIAIVSFFETGKLPVE
jgi:predicted tellurium resistance membrane protein TerC